MGETLDLGGRVELVPMDPHFHDITIALYRQDSALGPVFQVHSYSKRAGVPERLEFVVRAMAVLGGMEAVPGAARTLRFPCGAPHLFACRRVFLEACKHSPDQALTPRPLQIFDKKSERIIHVASRGAGAYDLSVEGDQAASADRLAAVANGLIKLGEMQPDGAGVAFNCARAHDALVGLLLVRALNVRAVLREVEMTAARGVLAAPSAQR